MTMFGSDEMHTFVLTDEEQSALERMVADKPAHNPLVRHPESFFIGLKAEGRRLPPGLLNFLDRYKLIPMAFPAGYIVIRNLPKDAARCTPRSHRDPVCDPTTIGEWVNMLVSNALGDTFTLANEYDGRYPNPIVPQPDKQEEASSAGSAVNLGWHQDLIAMDQGRADWLSLTCIKAAPAGTGATTIAPLCDALPLISPASITVLRGCRYTVDPPASCKGKISPLRTSVLGGVENAPFLTFQDGGTNPIDPEDEAAAIALLELRDALNRVKRDIYLNPGDTLIFRNGMIGWNVAHGRSMFPAKFDNANFQANRFLVRSYIKASIVPVVALCYPGTRVMVPTSLYRSAFAE